MRTLTWGIRARVMLVAVLPTVVLTVILTTAYTSLRLSDLDDALTARGRAYARQLAAASEYAVFSGDRSALQQLGSALLTEEDVSQVTILDGEGKVLAHAQRETTLTAPAGSTPTQLRLVEPIRWQRLQLDDGFQLSTGALRMNDGAEVRGSVIIDLSLSRLQQRRRELLWTGGGSMIIVLLGSLLLASRMSNGVSGPIRGVANTVLNIGRGQFHERVPLSGGGSLRRLAEGVNEMAERLTEAHEQMSRKVEEATAELRARKEEAERANLAKSRFLAAASHDLRQPMHALGLFVSELTQQTLSPSARQVVDRIASSAEAMENLLDSLLDISRLDAGVLTPSQRAFALQPALERIVAEHMPAARTRKLRLRLRQSPLWAFSDPILFERIIGNLLANAVRYTADGTVLIACRRRGQRVRVEVRDSGSGIAPEAQDIIFQEFVQLDNAERSRDKGLGLGLAIVRRLVNLLGHRLDLRSAPMRGSIFAIELPMVSAEPEPAATDEDRALGNFHGIRVALIDDDPLARDGMHRLLQSWGCEVSADESGDEFIERLANTPNRPEIMITDFRLRGALNGLELAEHVRTHFTELTALPVILISGDTAADILARAHGAHLPLLHKPVRPARLRALMHRLLNAA